MIPDIYFYLIPNIRDSNSCLKIANFLGNTWIDKRTDFDKVYGMWTEFRKSAIDGIGGMTMNERLYWFGLFDLFDNAKNKSGQEKFYGKLMAKK